MKYVFLKKIYMKQKYFVASVTLLWGKNEFISSSKYLENNVFLLKN